MGRFFEGWYLKHQNQKETLAVIPGIAEDSAFIQIITNTDAYQANYPKCAFHKGKDIQIEKNQFSSEGMTLAIDTGNLRVHGAINYTNLTPPASDMMGFFRFFPMQCRHGVCSFFHRLSGQVTVNGKTYDFRGGTGYIEKDSGKSFPKKYLWVQSNAFAEKACVMAAVAHIPFFGGSFTGLLAAVWYRNKEYRIATYNGGQLLLCNEKQLMLANRSHRLEILLPRQGGHRLSAPEDGQMRRIIHEHPSAPAYFRFWGPDGEIFAMESPRTSYEWQWE